MKREVGRPGVCVVEVWVGTGRREAYGQSDVSYTHPLEVQFLADTHGRQPSDGRAYAQSARRAKGKAPNTVD